MGWISRAVDPQDNRLTNASLTPAGQAVVNEALPKRAAFFDESLKGLSAADIDTLNRVLSVLEQNFLHAAGDRPAQG
jgi:DNA-binding MarR family transcriptional regulator